MKKKFITPILVLTVICLAVSGALALMNRVTGPIIEAAAADRAEEAMRAIIPDATGFEQIDTDGLPATVEEAYVTENSVGYIFIAVVNGYGGEIRVICGMDMEGRLISASTLQHSETKGIGTILEDASFLGRFEGKDSRLDGVSTVTGATISTSAFINAVKDVFAAFETVRGVG